MHRRKNNENHTRAIGNTTERRLRNQRWKLGVVTL